MPNYPILIKLIGPRPEDSGPRQVKFLQPDPNGAWVMKAYQVLREGGIATIVIVDDSLDGDYSLMADVELDHDPIAGALLVPAPFAEALRPNEEVNG